MPSIKIAKQCQHSPADAFKRISELLANDQDLRKLDSSYKAEFNSASLTGTANGSMFKANMRVKEADSGSHVEIVVDLPLAVALFKGTVEKTLSKKLDKALA